MSWGNKKDPKTHLSKGVTRLHQRAPGPHVGDQHPSVGHRLHVTHIEQRPREGQVRTPQPITADGRVSLEQR
eukprot:2677571-Prorocentrum_lima.AAC.1